MAAFFSAYKSTVPQADLSASSTVFFRRLESAPQD